MRSWQDAVYDTNTFVTMGTIAFYVFVEILPVMIVVDSNFLDVVSEDRDSDLTEPLFNTSRISGITE